jgi:hypothetical protein
MPLTACPDCSNKVSTEAKACPHCGRPQSIDRPRSKKKEVTAGYVFEILVYLAILVYGISLYDDGGAGPIVSLVLVVLSLARLIITINR